MSSGPCEAPKRPLDLDSDPAAIIRSHVEYMINSRPTVDVLGNPSREPIALPRPPRHEPSVVTRAIEQLGGRRSDAAHHLTGMQDGPPYVDVTHFYPEDPKYSDCPLITEPGHVLTKEETRIAIDRRLSDVQRIRNAIGGPGVATKSQIWQTPVIDPVECRPAPPDVPYLLEPGTVSPYPTAYGRNQYKPSDNLLSNGKREREVPKHMENLPYVRAKESSLLNMMSDSTRIEQVGIAAAVAYSIEPLLQLTDTRIFGCGENQLEIQHVSRLVGTRMTFRMDMTMADLRDLAQRAMAEMFAFKAEHRR